ncbi:hypothetical protein ACIGW4_13980 [Streptomyces sp. NPDC053513]|uniref:hypothetical protein n=1 Tax=unclassified Streptomyces TaxID=2593676 RepID=UPI0037CFE61D
MLGSRFPDHSVTIVPADTALRAGWALTSRDKGEKVKYRYRPQYFAEVWRPGEPSLVIPLACKGNHSDSATSAEQLASASAHAEAVRIGAWNEPPGLLFSTQLPTDGGTMTVHVLQAPGSDGRLSPAEGREASVMPDIHPPTKGLVAPEPVRGCPVRPKDYAWFQESLAHTTAASLMAFTGSGHVTARHLTDRQGRKRFTGLEHAASMSIQDAAHTLFGNDYVGTDHVFHLNGPRVEAFSGVDEEIFRLLVRGDVEEYRTLVHASRRVHPPHLRQGLGRPRLRPRRRLRLRPATAVGAGRGPLRVPVSLTHL